MFGSNIQSHLKSSGDRDFTTFFRNFISTEIIFSLVDLARTISAPGAAKKMERGQWSVALIFGAGCHYGRSFS